MLKATIRYDKRWVGKRVRVVNPDSPLYGETGTIVGFHSDQSNENPYVLVSVAGLGIETIPAQSLDLIT